MLRWLCAPPHRKIARAAEAKANAAAEGEPAEITTVRPLDHGLLRLRAELPTFGRLALTSGALALLFAGWGGYGRMHLVGVPAPSVSLDLLPFLVYFVGYVGAYWTEGYAIRTGRLRPTLAAATALALPVLGRYPVLPSACFLAACGQLLSVHTFALLRLARAGPINVWAYLSLIHM